MSSHAHPPKSESQSARGNQSDPVTLSSSPTHERPSTSGSVVALRPSEKRSRLTGADVLSSEASSLGSARSAFVNAIGPPSQYQHPSGLGQRSLSSPQLTASSPNTFPSSRPLPPGPETSPADLSEVAVAKRLLITRVGIDDAAVERFYQRIFRQVVPPTINNQNQWPFIRSLTDADLLFPQEVIVSLYGHCAYLVTRTRRNRAIEEQIKLIEGGTNNDSPRTNLLEGCGNAKVYIYHILARSRATHMPTVTMNLDNLRGVSIDKADDQPSTIVHLCGHKWCLNSLHYDIAPKSYNDEQVHCHRGLESCTSIEEMRTVRDGYCRHKGSRKCWTLNYRNRPGVEFTRAHHWS